MKQISCDPVGITLTAKLIKNGGVVIFPTDTVYGIGCDPYNQNAINRIFAIKKRDKTKQLPILGYSKKKLEDIVKFDVYASKIADKFWPGELTMVLPLKDDKLKKLSGSENSLAVRVPNNKCALSLLKKCKLIVGTSANISGKESFTDPQNLDSDISKCDIFLNGGLIQNSSASTIIKIENKDIKILRSGNISKNDLEKVL